MTNFRGHDNIETYRHNLLEFGNGDDDVANDYNSDDNDNNGDNGARALSSSLSFTVAMSW